MSEQRADVATPSSNDLPVVDRHVLLVGPMTLYCRADECLEQRDDSSVEWLSSGPWVIGKDHLGLGPGARDANAVLPTGQLLGHEGLRSESQQSGIVRAVVAFSAPTPA